jgi:hypothetical protein
LLLLQLLLFSLTLLLTALLLPQLPLPLLRLTSHADVLLLLLPPLLLLLPQLPALTSPPDVLQDARPLNAVVHHAALASIPANKQTNKQTNI